MFKMTVDKLVAEINRIEPGLLGTPHVSHVVRGDKIHLLAKDNPDSGEQVWLYANSDGTFTYERDGVADVRRTVDGLIEAVFGNEEDEHRPQRKKA